MNAKTAKALRKIVRQMVTQGLIPAEPYVEYGRHKTTGSIIVNPRTPKGAYRSLKRRGIGGLTASVA